MKPVRIYITVDGDLSKRFYFRPQALYKFAVLVAFLVFCFPFYLAFCCRQTLRFRNAKAIGIDFCLSNFRLSAFR